MVLLEGMRMHSRGDRTGGWSESEALRVVVLVIAGPGQAVSLWQLGKRRHSNKDVTPTVPW